MKRRLARVAVISILFFATGLPPLQAADWTTWRGPGRNGTSTETGLISNWSPEGKNLLWKADMSGRSTPVVVDGRVCVIGRTETRQERVACHDAATGRLLWENRFNVYQTTVPFNRVGWASLEADPETGNVYAQGVGGQLIGYAPDGKILWSRFLTEEFGRMSGYGGRTQTPVIDGDQLIINFVSKGWGPTAPMRHRYYAFDKLNGDLFWVSTPGGVPADFNTQSVPVLADIKGQHLIIAGAADGFVYGLKAATGEKVWSFQVSKRALNSTVVVDGDMVFVGHSEENLDEPTMGRVLAFRVAGEGDLATTQEVWRVDELSMGFSTPAFQNGKLYVMSNSANLKCLEAKTGKLLWEYSLGTVGKSSVVLADGKIYATEVNGRFHILEETENGIRSLDVDELKVPDGRYAEIYGSPAVANGRIYFTTEAGLYCLGDAAAAQEKAPKAKPRPRPRGEGKAAWIQVVPADALLEPGDRVTFKVRAFDAQRRLLGEQQVEWSSEGLEGKVGAGGAYSPAPGAGTRTGKVTARVGEIISSANVRVIAALPWSEDFAGLADGKQPIHWIAAATNFIGGEREGERVMLKAPRPSGLNRATTYIGSSAMNHYTIEADVLATKKGRRIPDIALINGGYIMDMQGAHQRLQVRSWTAELRMAQEAPFTWEPDVWYRMKFRVDQGKDKAVLKGKVWPRDEVEPAAWTITLEDALPIQSGSPGLEAYTPTNVYFDNLKVMGNK